MTRMGILTNVWLWQLDVLSGVVRLAANTLRWSDLSTVCESGSPTGF